jgi:hypothetical protein
MRFPSAMPPPTAAIVTGTALLACSARRAALARSAVVEIRGFADRKLLFPANPGSARNRRISLVVKFAGE